MNIGYWHWSPFYSRKCYFVRSCWYKRIPILSYCQKEQCTFLVSLDIPYIDNSHKMLALVSLLYKQRVFCEMTFVSWVSCLPFLQVSSMGSYYPYQSALAFRQKNGKYILLILSKLSLYLQYYFFLSAWENCN